MSLVLPAYNEAANITNAVREFARVRTSTGDPVFDTDDTATLAAEAGARVVVEPNQGCGNALHRGLTEASGELIVTFEPDGTFIATDVLKLLSYSADFEMVCGTRTSLDHLDPKANMGWFLRRGNFWVAKGLQILYDAPSLTDCGCTFRLVRRTALDRFRGDLFVGASHFLPNMVIATRKHDVTMVEVPLNYRGRVGESKITGNLWGTWKTGLAMIALILYCWPGFLGFRLSRNRTVVDG